MAKNFNLNDDAVAVTIGKATQNKLTQYTAKAVDTRNGKVLTTFESEDWDKFDGDDFAGTPTYDLIDQRVRELCEGKTNAAIKKIK